MSINPNHIFDELDGVKCSVIEKNCTAERIAFLKELLSHNNFQVVVVKSPPAKVPAKPAADTEAGATDQTPPPETFTIGVTDLMFNTINAIYNRELKTPDGKVVGPAYWRQEQKVEGGEGWYWRKG